jgi:hypothetical protein
VVSAYRCGWFSEDGAITVRPITTETKSISSDTCPVTRFAWHLTGSKQHPKSPSGDKSMKFLLALPFIGLLWVPFYNQETPTLFGFPFFYWYQFLWVPITSLLIWIVFKNGQSKGEE